MLPLSMQSVEGTMKVWRIENPATGTGPWMTRHRAEAVLRDCPATGHHPSNGPCVAEDCWPSNSEAYHMRDELMKNRVCGCVSLDQLVAWWFKPYHLQLLEDNGFVLREYEVPENMVARGRAQVAVVADAMVLVAEHKPTYATLTADLEAA